MRLRAGDALWMGSGFGAAFAAAAAILIMKGANERGIVLALMFTARVAFLAFWPAYSAGALASLFGSAFDRPRRKAREFGLAFAAALAVHVGLVGLLCALATPPVLGVFVFFGVAAIFAYALVLFSFEPMRSALGPERWRLLSAVGMNYIAYAFIADFVGLSSLHSLKAEVFYLPFALLALAAPTLRLAASLARLGRHRLEPHQRQT